MRRAIRALFLLAVPAALAAQTPTPDARTLGWQVRPDGDSGALATLSFVEMKPGFHVTTNRFSGIMYHPATTANGSYTATMTVYFFAPKSGHHEAYGLFVGGSNLASAKQGYTYFVIRNSGEYLIRRRTGATTVDVAPWTKHTAIAVRAADATADVTAKNVLAVTTTHDSVQFLVNGTVVATRPRSQLGVDGVVGMRINHMLDVHVSELAVKAGS
jgi:hypothetical protein